MSEYVEFRISSDRFNNVTGKAKHVNTNNPQERSKALQLFKREIDACENLTVKEKSCRTDDNFLYRFLYIQKFQHEDALQLFLKYFNFKTNNADWLKRMNIFDEKIQMALRDGNPRVLPQRDRKGRKIITFAASNWDPEKYGLIDIYRAFLITIDKLLENVHNQALGFVVIVDWTEFNYAQSKHLKLKILKLMITSLQECIPANFKGVHFVSQPWYIDLASTLIKNLLTEKMKNRLVVHGSNLSTLHTCINKDVLPPDLGGEGPNITTLDWYHYLLESSQTASAQIPQSYRLIENAVYATIPQAHQHNSNQRKQSK